MNELSLDAWTRFCVIVIHRFYVLNGSAGLTKVSLREYLLGTVGIVPGTLAFVYIGASTAGTMNEEVCVLAGVDRIHKRRKHAMDPLVSHCMELLQFS